MFSKRMALVASALALGSAVPMLSALAQPPAVEKPASRDEANRWMQSKLTLSQEIFAAMTRGESKAIETAARRMLVINIMEQWKANKPYMDSTEYDAQLNAFEYAVKELARNGRDNNINGALDAYVLLSKSCVKCHQAIRDPDSKK